MTESSGITPCSQSRSGFDVLPGSGRNAAERGKSSGGREIVLLGERDSKRSDYFCRAAGAQGCSCRLVTWEQFRQSAGIRAEADSDKRAVLKIDPPSYHATRLEDMSVFLSGYRRLLEKLSETGELFLNHPSAVAELLDKRRTKKCLQAGKLPVTKCFPEEFASPRELFRWMDSEREPAVFVKPRYFSGAAGVMALRRNSSNRRMTAYTSCRREGEGLVNTKYLFTLNREEEITDILARLLKLSCVVERWHAKDRIAGEASDRKSMCYDLRVVWQFGHIAYIVPRASAGPITNLHLNNRAVEPERLRLPEQKLQEIEALCREAVRLVPGLCVAGIDVMLERGSRRPLLIEMNGQGDLIYQDIFAENLIYAEQVREMRVLKM